MPLSFPALRYTLTRQEMAYHVFLRITDDSGRLVMYCQQKMSQLKEHYTIYADEERKNEIFMLQAVKAEHTIGAFELIASENCEKIGEIRRIKGKQLSVDEWHLLDAQGNVVALMIEDSAQKAAWRRLLLGSLLPPSYDFRMANSRVGLIATKIGFRKFQLDFDFTLDITGKLDRRLALCAGLLLSTATN